MSARHETERPCRHPRKQRFGVTDDTFMGGAELPLWHDEYEVCGACSQIVPRDAQPARLSGGAN